MTIRNDVDAVQAVQKELGQAFMQKDLDTAVSLMTADVTLLGPKGPPVVGQEAVRKVYANLFDKFNVTVLRADCTVEIVGEAAVVVGNETITLVPVRGGRPASLAGRVVAMYRRDGGSWRLARALSVFAGIATTGRTSAHKYRSELLNRAQAEPGRIIYPEVA